MRKISCFYSRGIGKLLAPTNFQTIIGFFGDFDIKRFNKCLFEIVAITYCPH